MRAGARSDPYTADPQPGFATTTVGALFRMDEAFEIVVAFEERA